MKKREVIFSTDLYRISNRKIDKNIGTFYMFFRSADLEIINRKSYTNLWKNNFSLFHEIPPTLKSSLEKTTDRIWFKSFLYEAYTLAFYRKIVFTF